MAAGAALRARAERRWTGRTLSALLLCFSTGQGREALHRAQHRGRGVASRHHGGVGDRGCAPRPLFCCPASSLARGVAATRRRDCAHTSLAGSWHGSLRAAAHPRGLLQRTRAGAQCACGSMGIWVRFVDAGVGMGVALCRAGTQPASVPCRAPSPRVCASRRASRVQRGRRTLAPCTRRGSSGDGTRDDPCVFTHSWGDGVTFRAL